MFKTRASQYLLAGCLSTGLVVGAATLMPATELLDPAAASQQKAEDSMRSGKVKDFVKNPHGDVDGLVLDDGSPVHFPPHIGRKVVDLIKVGDKVEVEGRQETRPKGDVVYEAAEIRSQGQTIKVEHPQPPQGGPKGGPNEGPKGRKQAEPPMNATGKVLKFSTNPQGDADGFVLADETAVKFPPHLSKQLQELVKVGEEVRVEGRRHETPKGDIHLHADRILVVETGKSIEHLRPVPPAGGPRGPREEEGPSNADLMRELKAIRHLLEKQQQ